MENEHPGFIKLRLDGPYDNNIVRFGYLLLIVSIEYSLFMYKMPFQIETAFFIL